MVNKKCSICNKRFITHKCWIKRGGGKFCSRKCKGLHHSELMKKLKPWLSWVGKKHKKSTLKKFRIVRNTQEWRKKVFTETRANNFSKSFSGEKNPNWKGGLTPEYKRIRMSLDYKRWRKNVFERDKYTCQSCGQHGGWLEADHIKSFAHYPDIRFELSNGRTLCKPCHKLTDNYGFKGISK